MIALVYHFSPDEIDDLEPAELNSWAQSAQHRLSEH
jgi:hypothetical protein